MGNEYRIDYDALEKYIEELKSLEEGFPIEAYSIEESTENKGSFYFWIKEFCGEISSAQVELKSLIQNTRNFMTTFRDTTINNDSSGGFR